MKHPLATLAVFAPIAGFMSGAFAQDGSACAVVDKIVGDTNVNAPYMVDAVTRSEMATNDCATGTAYFHWSILTDQTQLSENWRTLVAENFRRNFCGDADLASVVRSGWRINATWTTNDGQDYSITVACP